MTATADLLRDLDRRNRALYQEQRIAALVSDYLAPTPRAAVLVSIAPPPVVDGRQRMASDRRDAG